MRGSCRCENISFHWAVESVPAPPRACQCSYCAAIGAAYVSVPATAIQVFIADENNHSIVRHGTETASFHECTRCGELVLVTSEINSVVYGVINARCLTGAELQLALPMNIGEETTLARFVRRQKNWCSPVVIRSMSDVF